MNHKALWRLRLKRLGLAMLLLVVLVAGALLVERLRGSLALNHRLAELAKHGERLQMAAFAPARAATSNDAAAALLLLTNRLDATSAGWKTSPPVGRYAAPGKLIFAAKLNTWINDGDTNDWPTVAQSLDQDNVVLESIHSALRRPGWNDGFAYDNGFLDFKIGPLVIWKCFSQRLALTALMALRQNDPESAVARIEDAGRLLKLQANSPLLIAQLVRIASAMVVWNATWEIIVSGRCSEPQLARLQAAWEGMDFQADMARAMRMERNMTLEQFDLMLADAGKRAKALDELEQAAEFGLASGPPTRGFWLHSVYAPVWSFAWARQDELRSLNRWQELIEFDRAARAQSWSAVSNQAARLNHPMGLFAVGPDDESHTRMNLYDRLRYLWSGETFSVGSSMTRQAMQCETQRRLLVTAVALRRWKLRTGKLPANLTALVPELLVDVPLDLMNKQPLVYQVAADGSMRLYSVGVDGRDDGGDPRPADAKGNYRSIWDGRDAIWPVAADARTAEAVAHIK